MSTNTVPATGPTVARSMTGFASGKGEFAPWTWTWDIRSVNAKGLDIRLRVPDWIEGLEPVVRKAVGAAVARGNVSVALRISRETDEAQVTLNMAALDETLSLMAQISARAAQNGMTVNPVSASEIASMRGVLQSAQTEDDTTALLAALTSDLPALLDAFNEMREHEGAALIAILTGQLDQIDTLVSEAEGLLDARSEAQADAFKSALARVMDNTDGIEPGRIEQELALIAVKSDVREELDRLAAHVVQARSLLASEGPRGRKLDFLMQEFNREANTLCSKAGFQSLTRIGLDLKTLIDQMREQVQNIE